LARLASFDRNEDEVLFRRRRDTVRMRADFDPTNRLIRGHVDDRDIVAGAVGDVQLLADFRGRIGGTNYRNKDQGKKQSGQPAGRRRSSSKGVWAGRSRARGRFTAPA